MEDFNIRIVFDRRGTASDSVRGTVEVEVYQRSTRMRRRLSTGVRVLKHQWRDGMVVNHRDAVELNLRVQKVYRELSEFFADWGGRLEDFRAGDQRENCFVDWLERQIESRTDLAEQTLRQHRTLLESVRRFGRFRGFEDLTVENVILWEQEVRKHVRKQSAVHDYHKRLKVYVNRAVSFGLIKCSPYGMLKISRGRSGAVRYLTDEERGRIEGLELEGPIGVVRDMFLLSCYTGLAYCDLVRVSRDDIVSEDGRDFICDRRRKTESEYRLLIMPRAKVILERYGYDMNRMSNQKCNVYLKAIAVLAGLRGNLTFHMGRHTFATWALKRGVGIEVVSKMLAHADIATTQIYARVLQSEVTAGFEKLMSAED